MKYEFVEGDSAQGLDGRVLRRIRARVDIPARNIRAGNLGGYIESESNLSQDGDAWVGGNARAYGGVRIGEGALLHGNAIAYDDAILRGTCIVGGQAQVCGHATVLGNARASGGVCIYGDASVSGDAIVGEQMMLPGGALVFACDLARYFGITSEGCLNPVTLYNDRSGDILVISNSFSGRVQDYLSHVNESETPFEAPMHLMMVEMACKKIKAAQAAHKKQHRMAA